MSKTEALLDALQAECNLLRVEIRRFHDEQLRLADEVDLERELTATQEESIRLSQAITQLEATQHEQGREAEERTVELR